MANTGDKQDQLDTLAENITDNNNNENTAARHRTYASHLITWCANLAELTQQIFQGPIRFSNEVVFDKNPTYLGNDIYQAPVPEAQCNYRTPPNTTIQLTIQEQLVDNWQVTGALLPVGITLDGGEFTAVTGAKFDTGLERAYLNYDKDPAEIVNVNMRVEATYNGNTSDIMNRSLPIAAATANDEPGTLTPYSSEVLEIQPGTTFRVYVSAVEGASTEPEDCRLVLMALTAHSVFKLTE